MKPPGPRAARRLLLAAALLAATSPGRAAMPSWEEVVADPAAFLGAEVRWELEVRTKTEKAIEGRRRPVIVARRPEESAKGVYVLPVDPSLGVMVGGVVAVEGRVRGIVEGRVVLEEKDATHGYRLEAPKSPGPSASAKTASAAPERIPAGAAPPPKTGSSGQRPATVPPSSRPEPSATARPAQAVPAQAPPAPPSSKRKVPPPDPVPDSLSPLPEPSQDARADSADEPYRAAPGEGRVREGAALRSGPGTRYKQLGRLEPRTIVRIEGVRGEWVRVRHGRDMGWVHRDSIARLIEAPWEGP